MPLALPGALIDGRAGASPFPALKQYTVPSVVLTNSEPLAAARLKALPGIPASQSTAPSSALSATTCPLPPAKSTLPAMINESEHANCFFHRAFFDARSTALMSASLDR